jgi:MFS transporter, ACS family, tartrate transporter
MPSSIDSGNPSKAGSTEIATERLRRRISRRLLPFLSVLYVIAYLDRANIAFTKIPMTEDLGFSDAVFGFGAGMFFLGYLALQIPGALIVERHGARLWIGRIMVSWGAVTILFAFVKTPGQFYACRLLLGIAEAGFFPGVIVYLTHWFRRADTSRALAGFMIGSPIALVLGAPLSALMLKIQWMSVSNWRWIFILQGLMAVVFGVVALFYLTDSPRNAKWLDTAERLSLEEALSRDNAEATSRQSYWRALTEPNILLLCAAYAFVNIAGYGYIFWLPTAIKTTVHSTAAMADAISAVPFGLAAIALYLVADSSDRTGRPKLHACIPMLSASVFFLLAVVPGQPGVVVLIWLCLTGASVFAWIPGFWMLPTSISVGHERAAAVGLINSFGSIGGFLGPAIIGYFRTKNASGHVWVAVICLSYCAAATLTASVRTSRPVAVEV